MLLENQSKKMKKIMLITLILLLVGYAWLLEKDRRFTKTAVLAYYPYFYSYVTGANNSIIRMFIKPKPFPPMSLFPMNRYFERSWWEIRREAEQVLRIQNLPEFRSFDQTYESISQPGTAMGKTWRVFVFKFYNKYVEENCRRCPVTSSLIKKCPNIYAAMFSILDAKYYIPPHRGPSSACLRYHLGVIIPEDGECFIRVDGLPYHWKNGEGILFDDTFVHEVLNNTSKRRVVLFCDVLRADMPPWLQTWEKTMANSSVFQKYFEKYNRAAEVGKYVCCGADCPPQTRCVS